MRSRDNNRMMLAIAGMALLLAAPASVAVKVGDITHLQGTRSNKITGFGLVVGLKGTGDGGKFAPTVRPLAALYKRFANPVSALDELKDVKNVAIVYLEATLPQNGVREGERIDVQISSVGAAKSLLGGRLLLTPLVSPNPDDNRGVMAMASGPVEIDNAAVPTVGRIVQGATLEQNWVHNYIVPGRELEVLKCRGIARPADWVQLNAPYATFVIDDAHAEWSIAYTIAQSINEEASIADENAQATTSIAMAVDPRTVLVRIPDAEQANPAPFLARLERLQLFMPMTEARVSINRSTGTIVITGDVEIAPTVIAYRGLTITTLQPEPTYTAENPRIVQKQFVPLDPQKKGGAKLKDLVDTLDQLRVTVEDQINIIEQLHKTGELHATLIVEK